MKKDDFSAMGRELFSRLVFSIAISDTDGHLRNHGFLRRDGRWELSPAYDLNPSPDGDRLPLDITDTDNLMDFCLALETAPFYGLQKKEALSIIKNIRSIVAENWRKAAVKNGIPEGRLQDMAPAFFYTEGIEISNKKNQDYE